MTTEKAKSKLMEIANHVARRGIGVDCFYFTSLDDGGRTYRMSDSFTDMDDVVMYLSNMSLTHGIMAAKFVENLNIVSTVLVQLKDYSKPEIDADVIGMFMKLKI